MATSQTANRPKQVGAVNTAFAPEPLQRNLAVDAYRGLVMLLMMGEVLRFAEVARSFPNSTIWRWLAFNQSHVEWAGMSLHDTIQPGFTFLVGVALPYSVREPHAQGGELPADAVPHDVAERGFDRAGDFSAVDSRADD